MFTFFNVANRKILNYVNGLHYMSIKQWWFRESGKEEVNLEMKGKKGGLPCIKELSTSGELKEMP